MFLRLFQRYEDRLLIVLESEACFLKACRAKGVSHIVGEAIFFTRNAQKIAIKLVIIILIQKHSYRVSAIKNLFKINADAGMAIDSHFLPENGLIIYPKCFRLGVPANIHITCFAIQIGDGNGLGACSG